MAKHTVIIHGKNLRTLTGMRYKNYIINADKEEVPGIKI